jgi:hypothetical protein
MDFIRVIQHQSSELNIAIARGEWEVALVLVDDDADYYTLYRAIQHRAPIDLIRKIVYRGYSLEALPPTRSCLHQACIDYPDPELLELLVHAGCSLEQLENGYTPLGYALRYEQPLSVIQTMLRLGADPRARGDSEVHTEYLDKVELLWVVMSVHTRVGVRSSLKLLSPYLLRRISHFL